MGKSSLIALLATRIGPDVTVRRGYCDNVATPAATRSRHRRAAGARRLDRGGHGRHAAAAVPRDARAARRAADAADPRGRALGRRGDARADPLPRTAAGRYAPAAARDVPRRRGRTRRPADRGCSATSRPSPYVDRMHLPTLTATRSPRSSPTPAPPSTPTPCTGGPAETRSSSPRCWPPARPTRPSTVRDAVLARVAALSPAARDVLDAAAVLGPGASLRLLGEVAGQPAEAVDECVRPRDARRRPGRHRVRRSGTRSPARRSRPASGRRRTPPARRRPGRPDPLGGADDHRLAHHAAGSAGTRTPCATPSPPPPTPAAWARTGRPPASTGSRCASPRSSTGEQTAALYDRLSYECYLTNEPDAALAARRRALELHEQADPASEAVGAAQRWMSRLFWFLGRGAEAERYADLAVATLEPLAPGHELAMALSNKAQLAMLAGRVPETLDWAPAGGRAGAVHRRPRRREPRAEQHRYGTALRLRPARRHRPAAPEPRHRRDRRPARARRSRLHEPRSRSGPQPGVRRRRPRPARRDRLLLRSRPRRVGPAT